MDADNGLAEQDARQSTAAAEKGAHGSMEEVDAVEIKEEAPIE